MDVQTSEGPHMGMMHILGKRHILVRERQLTLSHSSAEVEYRGVANVVFKSCWLRNLLLKLHCRVSNATLVYYDNISVVYLSSNHIQH